MKASYLTEVEWNCGCGELWLNLSSRRREQHGEVTGNDRIQESLTVSVRHAVKLKLIGLKTVVSFTQRQLFSVYKGLNQSDTAAVWYSWCHIEPWALLNVIRWKRLQPSAPLNLIWSDISLAPHPKINVTEIYFFNFCLPCSQSTSLV